MPNRDKEKQREYNRRWYLRHAEEHKARARKRKQALRAEFYKYKATKACLHCNEKDIVCLEFHHVDPSTKDGDPAMMVEQKSWTMDKLIAYLEATCIVLCSNCHKKIHRDIKENERRRSETSPRPPAKKAKRKVSAA